MKKLRCLELHPLAAAIALLLAASPVFANDTDRDGLSDTREQEIGTNYLVADSDGGGADDGWEVENGLDPLSASDDVNLQADWDSDNDGLPDWLEGDNVLDFDSDQDGLPDTIEIGLVDANRDGFLDDLTDVDFNGMPDVADLMAARDNYPDFDRDGIPDYLDVDADNDGLDDIYEYNLEAVGLPPLPTEFPYDPWDVDGDGFINSNDADADGDGKPDADELDMNESDSSLHDLDNDGVPNHLDPNDRATYFAPHVQYASILDTSSDDMDHDLLLNSVEARLGTDPMKPDTDGGGAFDAWELQLGFDPLDPSDDRNIPLDLDHDNDGVLNDYEGKYVLDADSDGDGRSDALEAGFVDTFNKGQLNDQSDLNKNGLPDRAEAVAFSGEYPDFDGDGFPDYLDADSDNDGVYDKLEYDTSWVPQGYEDNPLDVDGDGQLNAMDLDSDNDGILDFDEQKVNETPSDPDWNGAHPYPTKTDEGQIEQLLDDDGDGIPNGIDSNGGLDENGYPHVDSTLIDTDFDDIRDIADVDHAYILGPEYTYWDDEYQVWWTARDELPTEDTDGDNIQDEYDWDNGNDGALDFTANATLIDTADNDGVPAIFDADDLNAYIVPVPEVIEPVVVVPVVDQTLIPIQTPITISPAIDDADRDGLTYAQEIEHGTDPGNADSDGGGVLDAWEIANGFNPLDLTDDASVPPDLDIDNDGVLNAFEGENTNDADSDGDGISDANEIGLLDANNDGFLDDLTDRNNNGMPDVAEPLAVSSANPYQDFDGDGFLNHLDVDSDNDGVYDKLEYNISWVPESYTGNPLDIDGDGQLNAMDYDSDGDGVFDFDEQRISSTQASPDWIGIYYSPTRTDEGLVFELADNDGDGIPNQADANGGADTDGDGIANYADIDHAVHENKDFTALYGFPYLVATGDSDGDGIENDFDWDSNNDGALDASANLAFFDTADYDGIPAIYDANDLDAYMTPEPENMEEPVVEPEVIEGAVVEPEVTEEPVVESEVIDQPVIEPEVIDQPAIESEVIDQPVIESENVENPANESENSDLLVAESENDTPSTAEETDLTEESVASPAAANPENGNSSGGSLGFWAILALGFARVRLCKRKPSAQG